ncbi:MAG: hypothetical protein ABIG11_10840 [bacterium]
MKSLNTTLGWFALAAALAVPALLFYNWWTRMNAEKMNLLQEGQEHAAAQRPFFKDTEEPLPPPSTYHYQNAAGTRAVARAADPAVSRPRPRATQPGSPGDNTPLRAGRNASDPAAVSNTSVSVAAARVAFSTSTRILFAPKTDRDPTLSPEELAMIREEAERLERLRNMRRRPVVPRERRVEDRLELQGIVESAGGSKAIINGEMRGRGSVVHGAKIVRVNSASVLFDHNGRRFTLRMP